MKNLLKLGKALDKSEQKSIQGGFIIAAACCEWETSVNLLTGTISRGRCIEPAPSPLFECHITAND